MFRHLDREVGYNLSHARFKKDRKAWATNDTQAWLIKRYFFALRLSWCNETTIFCCSPSIVLRNPVFCKDCCHTVDVIGVTRWNVEPARLWPNSSKRFSNLIHGDSASAAVEKNSKQVPWMFLDYTSSFWSSIQMLNPYLAWINHFRCCSLCAGLWRRTYGGLLGLLVGQP